MPSATTNQSQNQIQGSNSTNEFVAPIPRDARLVALILASMGVDDCEPAVLIQLLEFAHKYTHDVLSDALVYSDHASTRQGATQISLEDVQLAVQSRVNYSFTSPPPKEMLISLADSLNRVPLPLISEGVSLRLPPPNQRLTNVNFSIIPDELPERRRNQPQDQNQDQDQNASNVESNGNGKDGRIEDDDYDEEEDEVIGDVSMKEPPPAPSNNHNLPLQQNVGTLGKEQESRGTKRSLEEDEDYD